MKRTFVLPVLLITLVIVAAAQHNAPSIVGRWMSTDQNLEVEVYQAGNEYRAKVVWFDDSDDKNQPMNLRCDWRNPDKLLRNRKVIGLEVMHSLVYNPSERIWENGRIYDPSTGKDWNAKAWLTKEGFLKVRGFWHFEFLGQNLSFKKYL